MRLIEKECPNCGAGVKFNEDDKSCKCEYCQREFEIERDKEDKKRFDPKNYKLTELKTPMKVFFGTFAAAGISMAIMGFIMFLAVVAFFIVIFIQIINLY